MLMHYDNGTGVTSGHAQGVREAYEDYKAKVVKFKDDVDRMFSLVTTDKWIVVPNTVGGVLIGAVSHHPMHVALENYKEWGEMKPNGVGFTFADVIVPFKWYKNMDCVPSNIRSELDIALMMFYTHINQNSFPTIGSSHKVWEAVETIATNTYNTNNASVFMLPK